MVVAVYPQQIYFVDIRQKSFKCTPKGIINYAEIRYAYKQMNHEPPKNVGRYNIDCKALKFLHNLNSEKDFTFYFHAFLYQLEIR